MEARSSAQRWGGLTVLGRILVVVGVGGSSCGSSGTVFTTRRAQVELGEWWPVLVIGAGLFALAAGLLSRGSRSGNPTIHRNAQGETR